MTQSRRAFYREPPVSQTLASEQEGHSPGGAMLSPPHPTPRTATKAAASHAPLGNQEQRLKSF